MLMLRLKPRHPKRSQDFSHTRLGIGNFDHEQTVVGENDLRSFDLRARIPCVLEIVTHAHDVVFLGAPKLLCNLGKKASICIIDPTAPLCFVDAFAEIETIEACAAPRLACDAAKVAVTRADVEPTLRSRNAGHDLRAQLVAFGVEAEERVEQSFAETVVEIAIVKIQALDRESRILKEMLAAGATLE